MRKNRIRKRPPRKGQIMDTFRVFAHHYFITTKNHISVANGSDEDIEVWIYKGKRRRK